MYARRWENPKTGKCGYSPACAVEWVRGVCGKASGSAAERFLFKFLDGLPKTKGLFTLNGRLEIPFGPNPDMEIDLLCTSRKVAIEVDGKLHFATPENYRRDRRKDCLLQKHGYTVLRFLAEDVLERIDDVMNVIFDSFDAIAPA